VNRGVLWWVGVILFMSMLGAGMVALTAQLVAVSVREQTDEHEISSLREALLNHTQAPAATDLTPQAARGVQSVICEGAYWLITYTDDTSSVTDGPCRV